MTDWVDEKALQLLGYAFYWDADTARWEATPESHPEREIAQALRDAYQNGIQAERERHPGENT